MASVRKRGSSYQIRVSCGLRVDGSQVIQTRTWKPDPNLTERQVERNLQNRLCFLRINALKVTSQQTSNLKHSRSVGSRNMQGSISVRPRL